MYEQNPPCTEQLIPLYPPMRLAITKYFFVSGCYKQSHFGYWQGVILSSCKVR